MNFPSNLFFVVVTNLFALSFAVVNDAVSCGSLTKLKSVAHRVRLHSHDVKYGSGSGQQSVTAVQNSDDHNSLWQIVTAVNSKTDCVRGTPVKCGQKIRLLHVSTGCLLHSHLFASPLSKNQEVSCFGTDGHGDTGDNWEVQCDEEYWSRDDQVRLKHVDTGTYLAVPGHKYGRPIQGQFEVATTSSTGQASLWQTAEGVFVMPTESQQKELDL